MNPLLGFIEHANRSADQHAAHFAAEQSMPRFHIDYSAPGSAESVSVKLTDFWSEPRVVADIGMKFPRNRQLTGSCVGAGGGNALATLIFIQRCLNDNATKAFIPFWPFDYGRCRTNEGDRGQGEGAMGSSFAATLVKEGVISASESGLPAFQNDDGLILSRQLELQWSDGASSTVTKWLESARVHPLGAAAPCKTTNDIKDAILNGYPVTFACNNYIGNAAVKGSGANARVMGSWNGRGGHQQYVIGYEDHPDFGPIFGVGNNWSGNTYPADPGGLPTCCCWATEQNVAAAMRLDSEVYALSHQNWFPAQPDVIHWFL